MFQFGSFPIFVVYSRHRQESVYPAWSRYYADLKFAEEYLKSNLVGFKIQKIIRSIEIINEKANLIDAVMEWDLIEDSTPKYKGEISKFEYTIKHLLTRISSTKIGQILLNSLNKQEPIWIVPFFGVKYTAKTDRFTPEQGGGIRIHYNPEDFGNVYVKEGVSLDVMESTLFHELVHAMRFSNYRFHHRNLEGDFASTEEFFAAQLQNVYSSSKGKQKLYSLYWGGFASKEESYKKLMEDNRLINALRYFLQTEPLANQAASLKNTHYNPFRDFQELETGSRKYFIDL